MPETKKPDPMILYRQQEYSKVMGEVRNFISKVGNVLWPYQQPFIPIPPLTPQETKQAWGKVITEEPEYMLPFAPNIDVYQLAKALYGTGSNLLGGQPGMEFAIPLIYAGPKATGFSKATGKFSSMADKMERFEISDEAMKLLKEKHIGKLEEVIDHPELFKNYPELRNMNIVIKEELGYHPTGKFVPTGAKQFAAGPMSSKWGESEPIIGVFGGNKEQVKNSLIHEIQHYIQEKEAFARGGNLETVSVEAGEIVRQEKEIAEKTLNKILEAKDRYVGQAFKRGEAKLDETWKLAEEFWRKNPELHDDFNRLWNIVYGPNVTPTARYKAYSNLAGEIEARDAAARMNLTPEERLTTPPYSSENIPLKDWIVKKEGGEAAVIPELYGTYYHGTPFKFDKFKGATYFHRNPERAISYGQFQYGRMPRERAEIRLMSAELNVRNPKILSVSEIEKLGYDQEAIRKLISEGYDSAMTEKGSQVVVFNPEDITIKR